MVRRNVSAFLQAAHDEGLMVHLRFGPYIGDALAPRPWLHPALPLRDSELSSQSVRADHATPVLRSDAEWDYGGFPWWVNSAGANISCLRCTDPTFETTMGTWLRVFVEHVRPFFASNGGPVSIRARPRPVMQFSALAGDCSSSS